MLSAIAAGLIGIQQVPTLIGFASLRADTYREGPTSGQFIEETNGRKPPFELRQPIQGFSAMLLAPGDRALALSDNGFGSKANSPDFELVFHSLHLNCRTGEVSVERTFPLRDPNRKVPWPILAEMETYPDSPYPVDATISERRQLTGWDFDPESFQQASDGSLWFGDEFGPFLFNTDVAGRLLRPPISLPGVFPPDNPLLCTQPNIGTSKGFEGLAIDAKKQTLYAMLEGPLKSAVDQRSVLIYGFDARRKRFTGKTWTYRMDDPSHAVSDLAHVAGMRFLAIERDGKEGLEARFKKVFLVDLERGSKREVVDLMQVADPNDANRDGGLTYSMPFATIEAVAIRDSRTLIVANDNNYPFSTGRFPGVPDNSEFAMIRLPRALKDY